MYAILYTFFYAMHTLLVTYLHVYLLNNNVVHKSVASTLLTLFVFSMCPPTDQVIACQYLLSCKYWSEMEKCKAEVSMLMTEKN